MFGINSGNFYREDGSGTTAITSALNDYWYHIRIVFRGSYGINYEGLTSTYTWKVFIDGAEYGNYTFVNNQDVEWFRPSIVAIIGITVIITAIIAYRKPTRK